MLKIKLPFGLRNEKLIHISELTKEEKGLDCNCVCPHCKDILIAKLGNKNVHHFAHKNVECESAFESGLHLFAKEVIAKEKRMRLPEYLCSFEMKRLSSYNFNVISEMETEVVLSEVYIEFDDVVVEKKVGDIIPDLILTKGESKLFVEIKVTHEVDFEKIKKIKKMDISTLEIDLSRLWTPSIKEEFSPRAIRNLIIHEVGNKIWIHNNKIEAKIKKRSKEIAKENREVEKEGRRLREEKRRKRERASKYDLKKLEKKIDNIIKLMDKEYQKECREKWDKEISINSEWISLSKRLNISLENVPPYLNKEIEGEMVFNCDRRIWQARLFNACIYKRLRSGAWAQFSVKSILEWLKKKPYPLPLNWDLVYTQDVSCYDDFPDLATVVRDFFVNLSLYGVVKKAFSTNTYDPAYHWCFERLKEDIVVPSEKYKEKIGKEYVEIEGRLHKNGGRYVAPLSKVYELRKK